METVRSTPADVLLVAVNARYSSPAYGARCLAASLRRAGISTALLEAEPDCEASQLLDHILTRHPRLVGFSVMVWNVTLIRDTLRLKQWVAPELPCIVGGPEIGDEASARDWLALADAAVIGEAEERLPELARKQLSGQRIAGVLRAEPPDPSLIVPPDTVYSDKDLSQRRVFVESSRGCPLHCAYCTSHSSPLRPIPFPLLEEHWKRLLKRGARSFHFLDRSFNANGEHGLRVLDFFLSQPDPGLRLHLEFLPSMPSGEWRERLRTFHPGQLHIEVGIQSLDPDVLRLAGRPADTGEIKEVLSWLCRESGARVHADLIAGLPGDTPEGLADSFDQVASFKPDALQLNLLKGLPGTPFRNRSEPFGLIFDPVPPYTVVKHPNFTFGFLAGVRRAAYCWDRLYNRRGVSRESERLNDPNRSLFETLLNLADRVVAAEGRVHALSRERLVRYLDSLHRIKEIR